MASWGTIAIGFLATAVGARPPSTVSSTAAAWTSSGARWSAPSPSWSYSFVITYGIALVLDRLMGLRVADELEHAGLDATVHAEQGYELGGMSVGS